MFYIVKRAFSNNNDGQTAGYLRNGSKGHAVGKRYDDSE
jgi:hypothetical protein